MVPKYILHSSREALRQYITGPLSASEIFFIFNLYAFILLTSTIGPGIIHKAMVGMMSALVLL